MGLLTSLEQKVTRTHLTAPKSKVLGLQLITKGCKLPKSLLTKVSLICLSLIPSTSALAQVTSNNLKDEFSELPTWVGLIVFIAIGIIILSCISLIFGRQSRARRVKRDSVEFFDELDILKKKVSLVDKHSFDYIHGIPMKLQSDYAHVKSLISLGDQVKKEILSCVEAGGYLDFVEAEELLDTPLNKFQTGSDSLIGLRIDSDICALDLFAYAERVIEQVGEEVAKASDKARELNFKPRERKATMENLMKAGVRYVNRQRRESSKEKEAKKTEEEA